MSRRPSLSKAIKAARKNGVDIARIDFDSAGGFSIIAAKTPVAGQDDLDRELQEWEARHGHQG